MRRVRLYHHSTASGKGRSGIAPGNGKGQRKITGSKYPHRPQRTQHLPQIGAGQGLTVGQGGVNAGVHPGTFAQVLSKQPELARSAAALARKPGQWQPRFGLGAGQEFIANGFNFVGYFL